MLEHNLRLSQRKEYLNEPSDPFWGYDETGKAPPTDYIGRSDFERHPDVDL